MLVESVAFAVVAVLATGPVIAHANSKRVIVQGSWQGTNLRYTQTLASGSLRCLVYCLNHPLVLEISCFVSLCMLVVTILLSLTSFH